MSILIIVIVGVHLIFALASVLTLYPDWKWYKKVYQELPNKEFFKVNDIVCSTDWKFIWFLDNSSFKLSDNTYIHNAPFTFFDPYSAYWYFKYKRWVIKNINIK